MVVKIGWIWSRFLFLWNTVYCAWRAAGGGAACNCSALWVIMSSIYNNLYDCVTDAFWFRILASVLDVISRWQNLVMAPMSLVRRCPPVCHILVCHCLHHNLSSNQSNQIKSNLFGTKKEHNATQKNKAIMSTGHKGSTKLH